MTTRLKTTPERSRNMSAIRGTNNETTELELLRLFREVHLTGWRRHSGKIFGRPDFVFKGSRVVVFVDGCFWHGCREIKKPPVANRAFWSKKIGRNKLRDKAVNKMLKKQGWRVVRIWEHELGRSRGRVAAKISKALLLQA